MAAANLLIVMVGLPARGKSTVAKRLQEGLTSSGIRTEIFNNGKLRRDWLGPSSALPEFYAPDNREGYEIREKIARTNLEAARVFFEKGGEVAIFDATNASRERREMIDRLFFDTIILFLECVNEDAELLKACVLNKANLAEFSSISHDQSVRAFYQRIEYYRMLASPLERERRYIRLDTLSNSIIEEHLSHDVPHYISIRDILVSDWVRSLFLVRHGQSQYNVEDRIGGDASLTGKGRAQALQLAACFEGKSIPYIFTSKKIRSRETAVPLAEAHPEARCITIGELDEIDSGVCEGMSYQDIKRLMPEEYALRSKDKYNYCYPRGEGYASMQQRVARGFRKALFLAGGKSNIVMIGHQAVNRMVLSLFLFRRTEDVPYIYVPQNQYFHIIATHQKKLFELVPFS